MDTSKLTALEFCVLVMWVQGWTISKIHLGLARRHGKTANAVRGIINKLPKRRQAMTLAERQEFLDRMKETRIDDGMLRPETFLAKPLASDQKQKAIVPPERKVKAKQEPLPEPDPKTRAGRREIKRRRREAELKKQAAAEERERRAAGLAPRGVEATPLEYLYHQKRLGNPEDDEAKGEKADRANNAMRRYEAGVRLRSMMESIYGSGMKSQDFESAGGGGGGAGVVIHAVVVENIKNVQSIRSMMPSELFHLLDQMLLKGLFVWQIPSQNGSEMIIEEIRDALDTVSVFLGTMPGDEDADVPKRADRRKIREANFQAREALAKAQRQAR